MTSLEARQQARRLQDGVPRAPTARPRRPPCWPRSARSASGSRPSCAALVGDKSLAPLAGYLREVAFLARTAGTIRTAIGSIRRIVGALKRYSRLDEAPLERVDVHAGIEDTLVILSHQLKYGENGVNVKRSFGSLPAITAYVGELNQVWTNLIHNAIQAMDGRGEILIETKSENRDVIVGDRGHRSRDPGGRRCRGSSSRSSPPRRRARGPASGSASARASSRSTAARSASTASPGARGSRSACRSRVRRRRPSRQGGRGRRLAVVVRSGCRQLKERA